MKDKYDIMRPGKIKLNARDAEKSPGGQKTKRKTTRSGMSALVLNLSQA